jgi:hypothetical protein
MPRGTPLEGPDDLGLDVPDDQLAQGLTSLLATIATCVKTVLA